MANNTDTEPRPFPLPLMVAYEADKTTFQQFVRKAILRGVTSPRLAKYTGILGLDPATVDAHIEAERIRIADAATVAYAQDEDEADAQAEDAIDRVAAFAERWPQGGNRHRNSIHTLSWLERDADGGRSERSAYLTVDDLLTVVELARKAARA